MSKRFEFERFDLRGCACDECDTGVTPRAEFDGEWVKAQDALDREAVLQARISTLEVQLKDRWKYFNEALARIEVLTNKPRADPQLDHIDADELTFDDWLAELTDSDKDALLRELWESKRGNA
ncbi:hypothetical protein [Paraburkholderia sp. C35]|uniref:hypothetical protein n=1 Tax=Paraburkholderia sp. C35 TaxID=2126993 RepID=UPI00195238FB|nr:hypothetical protein [Paraburkholderia sp. C35]